MKPDPFYRRSGFWTALVASVPFILAVIRWGFGGDPVVDEDLALFGGVWGTYFTATTVRRSVSTKRVNGLLGPPDS